MSESAVHPDVRFFSGNVEAFRFCEMVSYLANFWDDLVDRDTPMPEERIHLMMSLALVSLPANAFFQRNFAQLHPLMAAGAMEYQVARVWERSKDPHGLELAHGMRYSIGMLMTYVATMCGSPPELIAEMQLRARPERIGDYLKEFTDAQ